MLSSKQISNLFRNFSVKECKGSSDLYEHLSLKISEDEELIALASHAQPGQPVPNLLLGAVHYLLLKGNDHILKKYYGSLVVNPEKNFEQAFQQFKDFCQLHREEIISI